MLRKLYKHEFYALFRTLLPVYGILLGFAALTRISFFFSNSDLEIINVWKTLSTILSVSGILATFVVSTVLVVVRFYKHLLSKEGYLTFTLPFTATQHINCKLICSVVTILVNIAVTLLSVFIMGVGTNGMKTFMDSLIPPIKGVLSAFNITSRTFIIIEFFVLVILSIATNLLMFYVSMAIGQRFRNKILASVVAYFVIYAIVETISVIAVFSISVISIGMASTIDSLIRNTTYNEVSHGLLLFAIFIEFVMGLIYYIVTNSQLKKRLNLE